MVQGTREFRLNIYYFYACVHIKYNTVSLLKKKTGNRTLNNLYSGKYQSAWEGKLRRWNDNDTTVQFMVHQIRGKAS